MIAIDLQQYREYLRITNKDNKTLIYDPIRRKHLILFPEELVRQLLIQYLIREKSYSRKLIQVEKAVNINGQIKRFDLVIYNSQAQPKILVECKRPEEKIKQNVFNQISTYNLVLRADYMIVTNGVSTYCCSMNYDNNTYEFLDDLPNKSSLITEKRNNTHGE